MVLVKRLSSEQVIQAITALVEETLPEGSQGKLFAKYNKQDGSIEVTFVPEEQIMQV